MASVCGIAVFASDNALGVVVSYLIGRYVIGALSCLFDWLFGCGWSFSWLIALVGCLVGRLVGWLGGWVVGWCVGSLLVDCLACVKLFSCLVVWVFGYMVVWEGLLFPT